MITAMTENAPSVAKKAKPGGNWMKLKSKIAQETPKKPRRVVLKEISETAEPEDLTNKPHGIAVDLVCKDKRLEEKMRKLVLGLDCEMVGLGDSGRMSALARCSLVDFDGEVVYDTFVQPKGFVTDFRTKYSGVRRGDIHKSKAVTLEECQRTVSDLLKDKVLVGHALKNDLNVLFLSHPMLRIRDTAHYKPYMRVKNKFGKLRPRALKELTSQYLGKQIQDGEHNSVEDARCAVLLYRLQMEEWERDLKTKKGEHVGRHKLQREKGKEREENEIAKEQPTGDDGRSGDEDEEESAPVRKRKAQDAAESDHAKRSSSGELFAARNSARKAKRVQK